MTARPSPDVLLHPRPDDAPVPDVDVVFQPILDVARGSAAGFQALPRLDGSQAPHDAWDVTAAVVDRALAACSTLPTNTFISIPVPLRLVADPGIQGLLGAHGPLDGIVLDVTDFDSDLVPVAEDSIERYRGAGAQIAVGGGEIGQPELGSIVRLRPAIIRLGAAWTDAIDQNPRRRSAVEVTGQLAGQLDAWILADDVRTAAELRVLAQLGVPLARGPFIGGAQSVWPQIGATARTALPAVPPRADGVLRSLLQQAYTTRNTAAAQSVLPEASGFESVVVVDDASRPVSLLRQGTFGRWEPVDALTVNVATSVDDTVARALARPADSRFSPLLCTDDAGRFVGVLRIERLVEHLAARSRSGS